MTNKTYDLLKNIALLMPIFNTFIGAIFKIWNIPYGIEVNLTLDAILVLVCSIVKISNKIYKKKGSK